MTYIVSIPNQRPFKLKADNLFIARQYVNRLPSVRKLSAFERYQISVASLWNAHLFIKQI